MYFTEQSEHIRLRREIRVRVVDAEMQIVFRRRLFRNAER